jgi:hypothetical protein
VVEGEEEGMNIMSMDWEAMCKDRDVVINNFEAEIIKLRKALQQIHDSCISDSRWWNDESHAAPQDRPVTRILLKHAKIAKKALRED